MNDSNPSAGQNNSEDLISLTADIVAAHVSDNTVLPEEIAGLIGNVHGALAGLGQEAPAEERLEPAVSVRSSLKSDHLVSPGRRQEVQDAQASPDH